MTHFAAVERGKKTGEDRANAEPKQKESDRGRKIVLFLSMRVRGHIRFDANEFDSVVVRVESSPLVSPA
jgi:hypothetical protein